MRGLAWRGRKERDQGVSPPPRCTSVEAVLSAAGLLHDLLPLIILPSLVISRFCGPPPRWSNLGHMHTLGDVSVAST